MRLKGLIIKACLASLIAIAPFMSKAQVGYIPADKLNNVSESKTLVVLTEDEVYNKALKNALHENWDINLFNFVTEKELSKNILKKRYLILKHKNNKTSRGLSAELETMTLFTSGQTLAKLENESICAQSTIGSYKKNNQRIALQVKSILSTLKLIEENKINSNAKEIVEDQLNAINRKVDVLEKGTLLIDKKLIGNSVELSKIQSLYPHKIKVISNDEINIILDKKEAGVYLLLPSNVSKAVIYDTLSGEAIFASKNVIKTNNQQLNLADFQEITNALGK